MLKNIKNDITKIRHEDDCIPYRDCSAHDAAQEALDLAETELETANTNLNNAVNLQNQLRDEQTTASQIAENYKSVYDVMNSVGPGVANPQNMPVLSGIIDCVCAYGQSVEQAYNQAVDEVSRCEQEVIKCQKAVQKAQTKLANTPCVWGCK